MKFSAVQYVDTQPTKGILCALGMAFSIFLVPSLIFVFMLIPADEPLAQLFPIAGLVGLAGAWARLLVPTRLLSRHRKLRRVVAAMLMISLPVPLWVVGAILFSNQGRGGIVGLMAVAGLLISWLLLLATVELGRAAPGP